MVRRPGDEVLDNGEAVVACRCVFDRSLRAVNHGGLSERRGARDDVLRWLRVLLRVHFRELLQDRRRRGFP